MVQAAGAGTYAVGNVQAGTGGDRYAGWTLVVAYQDPSQPPRNLTVDDGLVTVQSGSPAITIPVSGFTTPPSGPVRTTLGFVAYEGDAGLTGDSATLNTTKLSDPGQSGEQLLRRLDHEPGDERHHAQPRTTSNNFAYDSMLVNANGILPNSATSANIVVTTSGDTYFPAVVTFATDLFAPNITSTKSVTNITHPGGPDQRGDDAAIHGLLYEHGLGRRDQLRDARRDPGRDDVRPGQPSHHGRSAGSGEPNRRARRRRGRVQLGQRGGGLPARRRWQCDDRRLDRAQTRPTR